MILKHKLYSTPNSNGERPANLSGTSQSYRYFAELFAKENKKVKVKIESQEEK